MSYGIRQYICTIMITEMKKKFKVIGFFGIGVLAGLLILIGITRLVWHGKFFPGVQIANIPVSGLTREEAKEKILASADYYHARFEFNGASWEAPSQAVEFLIDASLNSAYRHGRRLNLKDFASSFVGLKTSYPLVLAEGRTEIMVELLEEISVSVEIPEIEPVIEVVGGVAQVKNGSDGVRIDSQELDLAIRARYGYLASESVVVPVRTVIRHLSEEELKAVADRATILAKKKIVLEFEDEKIELTGNEIISLLSTLGGEELLDERAIKEYVERVAESLNREPQDAKFVFENGEVQEFAPGRDGVEVNLQLTIYNLQAGIEKLLSSESKQESIKIEATRTAPSVTTDKVNELGIRERIGRGESYYAHSIPNRVFNVGLAASRINSTLIAPGEEFSFVREVGDISSATGYRTAYVISGGRTVLGDGGGVCQVSTTAFRAAMDAGLPILERWAHAYRVGYYEQNSKPGVDATIYAPSKDFRFLNDTPGHILIQTINDPAKRHLVIEIYGTSDGRVATVSEPKVWGVAPPPPDLYQDDPSLPAGVVQQVDWSAWGAKTSFEYKVERDGQVIYEKTFNSSFRPWQNVFLRGTGI